MLRSNHGCWSCRIRRKKCDETKPVCTTCTSRNITCHGYGNKPAWLDGGEQEENIANELKKQIAENLSKLRRRKSSRYMALPRSNASSIRNDGTDGDTNEIHDSLALEKVTNQSSSSAGSEQESFSLISERLRSYREAELVMHYMDAVFPLQFRFHIPDARGRGWLLWLLVKSGPLYHAALSLSALHQSIRMSLEFRNSYAELAGYHAQALTDLRQFLQRVQENKDKDESSRKIQVLSCGVSLISFELFQGGTSDWQLHLNALISILVSGSTTSVVELLHETRQNKNVLQESSAWQGTALSFLITVILWFDILSCASTNRAPRMPYRELLDANLLDLSTTMGVKNRVMRSIGDIALLSSGKGSSSTDSYPNLWAECHTIEQALKQELDSIENETTPSHDSGGLSLAPSEHVAKVQTVTRVFATAALIQLGALFPDYESCSQSMPGAIEQNIMAIRSIRNIQDIRGLIWPICISGSIAQADQQTFYETTIKSALNDSPRDFGNCNTLLSILRWCWNERSKSLNYQVDWRHAMADIGACLLV